MGLRRLLSLPAAELSDQFARGQIRKTYQALLIRKPREHGPPSEPMHDGSLGHLCAGHVALRKDEDGIERMQIVGSEEEDALTATMRWRILDTADNGVALVQLEPADGRRHMLRVLCTDALGAGILGDYKYQRSRRHARFGFHHSGRICLHASELTFGVRP